MNREYRKIKEYGDVPLEDKKDKNTQKDQPRQKIGLFLVCNGILVSVADTSLLCFGVQD